MERAKLAAAFELGWWYTAGLPNGQQSVACITGGTWPSGCASTIPRSGKSVDPLSSQGIFKALRSGTFASFAIGDLRARQDAAGLERYRRYVRVEFSSYSAVARSTTAKSSAGPRASSGRGGTLRPATERSSERGDICLSFGARGDCL